MAQREKEKRGTQKWEWYLDDTIKSILESIAAIISRILPVEAFVSNAFSGILEFDNSMDALSGGLTLNAPFKTDNVLKTVGIGDVDTVFIPLAATSSVNITGPERVCLIDPYGRYFSGVEGLSLTHDGIIGDARLITNTGESIKISSTDISGYLIHQGTGDLDVSGCTSLVGVTALNTTNVDVTGCTLLESLVAPLAKNIIANGCALTAAVIEEIFAAALLQTGDPGVIIIDHGTNALYSELSVEGQADCDALIAAGWTITISDTVQGSGA